LLLQDSFVRQCIKSAFWLDGGFVCHQNRYLVKPTSAEIFDL
jgi:hypothetical protein